MQSTDWAGNRYEAKETRSQLPAKSAVLQHTSGNYMRTTQKVMCLEKHGICEQNLRSSKFRDSKGGSGKNKRNTTYQTHGKSKRGDTKSANVTLKRKVSLVFTRV